MEEMGDKEIAEAHLQMAWAWYVQFRKETNQTEATPEMETVFRSGFQAGAKLGPRMPALRAILESSGISVEEGTKLAIDIGEKVVKSRMAGFPQQMLWPDEVTEK